MPFPPRIQPRPPTSDFLLSTFYFLLFFALSTFLLASPASAISWNDGSARFDTRGEEMPVFDFATYPSYASMADVGPEWFRNALSGSMSARLAQARARASLLYDRAGDPVDSSTQYNGYVGTLHDVFDVSLFNNIATFVGPAAPKTSGQSLSALSGSVDFSWNLTGNFTSPAAWDTTTNWTPTAPTGGPSAAGIFVLINTDISTANKTINLNGTRTVGRLDIGDTNGSNTFIIAAGTSGVLNFDGDGSNAQLNELSTSKGDTISAPITLTTSFDITNASANTLTLSTGGITAATAGTKTITTSTGTVTISGIIGNGSGTVAVTQNGPGTLTLSGVNTYSGNTTISGGKINIGTNATPFGDGTGTLFLSGGTLNTTANRTASTAPVPNNVVVTADSAITTTATSGVGATISLNFTGTLTGTGGTLTFRNDGAATNGVFVPRFSGGDFTMSRPIVIDNGAGGGTTVLSDFNTTGTTHTYNGIISGNGSYSRSVSSGAGGTTVFNANNTYTGTTSVNAGTLNINNDGVTTFGRISGTSSIVVSSGGTLLLSVSSSVTDRINNSATMTLNGGTFNTGGLSERGGTVSAPTAGIGALTLTATSTINFGAGSTSMIEFSGVGTHTASTILNITNWDGIAATGGGTEALLFAGTSTDFTSLYTQSDVIFNGGTAGYLAIQFTGFYEITAVPEPSTWVGAALALLAVGYTQRRRIRSLVALRG